LTGSSVELYEALLELQEALPAEPERAIRTAFEAGEHALARELTGQRVQLLTASVGALKAGELMVAEGAPARPDDAEAKQVERLLALRDKIVDANDADDPHAASALLTETQSAYEQLQALCLRRGREDAAELAAEAERKHAAWFESQAAAFERVGMSVLADSLRRTHARIVAIANSSPSLPEALLARVRVSTRRRRPRSRGDRSTRSGTDPPPASDPDRPREGGAREEQRP
jgi:hypothetical protein